VFYPWQNWIVVNLGKILLVVNQNAVYDGTGNKEGIDERLGLLAVIQLVEHCLGKLNLAVFNQFEVVNAKKLLLGVVSEQNVNHFLVCLHCLSGHSSHLNRQVVENGACLFYR
jgi:uncharacterized membrane protein